MSTATPKRLRGEKNPTPDPTTVRQIQLIADAGGAPDLHFVQLGDWWADRKQCKTAARARAAYLARRQQHGGT